MSILDLLLAEALAAGMSRMTEDKEPTPDNFFVLPADPEAWRKLYATCTKEELVICVEVTKEAHPPSINTHPHFLSLARRVPNIPFIQVKTNFMRSFDKVREDLGGVETAPTLVLAFFDGDRVRIKQVCGEEKIKLGIRLGIIEGTLKEFLEKRAENKRAEKMAEQFAESLIGDLERRRKQEYEEKLKMDRANLEAREKENEELRKKEREKEREKQEKIDELLSMDLQNDRIGDIKQKMDELKIRHIGATTRDELIEAIKKAVPGVSLNNKGSHTSSEDLLINYVTSNRHTDLSLHTLDNTSSNAVGSTTDEEPDTLNQSAVYNAGGSNTTGTTDSEQQTELLETRMLYACTLNDMEILGKIATRNEEGVVVRAKCTKPGIPNPNRIYAMKIILNIHSTSTLTRIQTDFKNEYDILSSLPKHKNIIQLFAFFYDRPQAYPSLNYLQEGIALCLLMENLSQNMQDHIDALSGMGKGPKASRYLHWFRDVVCGLLFLFQNHIVHRDMKLDNLLLAGGESVKISDFGTAIRLDREMKLPFSYVADIRGGNEAHLAPEILNTRSKPGNFLNYSKQPVWEAGVLAYELAGHKSPFKKSNIDQRSYRVSALPPLTATRGAESDQEGLPYALTAMVHSMLEYAPDDRPTIGHVYDQLAKII